MDISARKAELESFSWQKLRDLCVEYGIEKEENDSWADCIPQILEHEEIENATAPELETPVIIQTPETIKPSKEVVRMVESKPLAATYATEFYKKVGVWTCPDCGEKRRTGMDGKPICPANRKNCKQI